jgi:hypothetical protein
VSDQNRTTLTSDLVDQMEEAMRSIQGAQEDLKAIAETALEHEFTAREVAAMKAIAKIRLKDKKIEAKEKLEALERVGKAVGFDLFDFAARGES